jgi:hypothetical protein
MPIPSMKAMSRYAQKPFTLGMAFLGGVFRDGTLSLSIREFKKEEGVPSGKDTPKVDPLLPSLTAARQLNIVVGADRIVRINVDGECAMRIRLEEDCQLEVRTATIWRRG